MKNIMQNRFSCRKFKADKLPDETVREILNITRLSPSSCGLEPWHFLVVSKEGDLKELGEICNNQSQVSDCSHAIIIIARNDLKSPCAFIRQQVDRRPRTPERLQKALDHFANRFDPQSDEELFIYATHQCYMAAANLVNIAYSVGVDSCIIAGCVFDKLKKFAGMGEHFRPVLVIALGKADEPVAPKIRSSLDSVATWR